VKGVTVVHLSPQGAVPQGDTYLDGVGYA
jgi:hypothetical protein